MIFLKETGFVFLFLIVTLSRANPITITAPEPKEVIKEEFRLKNYVKPTKYELDLTIGDIQTKNTFTGKVTITFTAGKNTIGTDAITLNSHKVVIKETDVELKEVGSPNNIQLDLLKIEEYEKYSFTPKTKLTENKEYTLVIPYDGTLHDDMYGFYRSFYTNEQGVKEWIATTQFQPTHARRAFPCFDEPNIKAEFQISITHPEQYHALGNTEGTRTDLDKDNMVKTTFKETPEMSTYLIAFIISKFPSLSGKDGSITNAAWSQDELVDTAKYGFDMAPKILNVMAEKLKVEYADSGLTKLDQVAIPDFSAGAMENWGLVTYRESALLWDKAESSARNKQRVASIVAHELAHMWFGNLVTCDWWEYTWLNEGFARFFEYYAPGQIEPTWELDNQFVVEQQLPVFNLDSSKTSQALSSEAYSPSEVSGKFGSITYNKGGSVIRMMQHFLTTKVFFEGLENYFKEDDHWFKNTKPDDLWAAMQKAVPTANNLPAGGVKGVMDVWTQKNGFPLVNVSVAGKTLTLSQQQFLFEPKISEEVPEETRTLSQQQFLFKPKISEEVPAETATIWPIPISYITSKEKETLATTPKVWFSKENEEFTNQLTQEDPEWIVLNVDSTAYYRVNYDAQLWSAIETTLKEKEDYDGIPVLNRAQIVDDAMNLARGGFITYTQALNIAQYLSKEESYYPWHSAFNAFAYLRRRINPADNLAGSLNKFISGLMQKLHESASFVGGSQKQIDIHKRVLTLTWACQLDNKECVDTSKQLFSSFRVDGVSVNPDLRGVVYCTAIRHSEGREDWEALWNRFKSTHLASETATIIPALGCSKDTELLKEYLEETIKADSFIRKQDTLSVFSSVISGSVEGFSVGLQFLKDKIVEIPKSYKDPLEALVNSLGDRITTEEQLTEFTAVLDDLKLEIDPTAAASAIANAKANLQWVEDNREELTKYFKDNEGGDDGDGGSASITASILIVVTSLIFTFMSKL